VSNRRPPEKLIRRVGWVVGAERPEDVFEDRGLEQWGLIKSLMPGAASVSGMRILDFGCGVGRILRAAVSQNPDAEYWGCDIDEPSVTWLARDLGQRARVFQSDAWPPLAAADGYFDLAYAFSVFTHLTDSWSAWLVELHRVLKQDGILIATVVGPGLTSHGDEPVSEDIVGTNVLYPSASWDTGGPLILHSEWWLRAHWGRAFDVLDFRVGDPGGSPPLYGQSVLVMRRRDEDVTAEQLETAEPDEPREIAALRQNVASLRREIARHTGVYGTNSWRFTAPLRAAANFARALAARRHR
jgi:SAM-dependent methyltransferase